MVSSAARHQESKKVVPRRFAAARLDEAPNGRRRTRRGPAGRSRLRRLGYRARADTRTMFESRVHRSPGTPWRAHAPAVPDHRVEHSEHALRQVVEAQVDDIGIDVADPARRPRGGDRFGVLAREGRQTRHPGGMKRRLDEVAVVGPLVALPRQQALAEDHLEAPLDVRLHEAARMERQDVRDRRRIGDDEDLLPEEARLDDAGGALAALVEGEAVVGERWRVPEDPGLVREADERGRRAGTRARRGRRRCHAECARRARLTSSARSTMSQWLAPGKWVTVHCGTRSIGGIASQGSR